MDGKLLTRAQALGGVLICVAYFLPWASIMTPLGSIEVRGLYVDYAWLILILAILHLMAQFARNNMTALALPDGSSRYIDLAWRGIPFVFVAFFAWYATGFILRDSSSNARALFFGLSLESTIRVGLDYGFWIGALGAILTLAGVGLVSHEARKFALYGVGVVVTVGAVAFGLSKISTSPQVALVGSPPPQASPAVSPPDPTLNASPYVAVTKISGTVLPKDIDANRYRDAIIISPVFKNVGSKTIVGLQGYISMIDGFGKEVYGFKFRMDDKLAPGEETTGGYNFEGNQFSDDDPYHKMLPLLSGGTAKYTSRISNIAFEDGTVLPK